MKILVKLFQGKTCNINILHDQTVLILKHKISQLFAVPVQNQKLIHHGQPLADDQLISFYPDIKEGSQVYLFVTKPLPKKEKNSPQSEDAGIQLFSSEMSRVLRHYYTESETQSIINEFMKDLKKKTDGLSFDDLERLATALLQDQDNVA